MNNSNSLPPGQRLIDKMPRFGLTPFANRFPSRPDQTKIEVGGDVGDFSIDVSESSLLTRVEQMSDFHCVTTWSKQGVQWSGFRFTDVFEQLICAQTEKARAVTFVLFRAQDGYKAGMYLTDLLASDVLLADRMNGEPLSIAHGAPLRLIAPAHYGYKSVKHLSSIEFWFEERDFRRGAFKFMDHPRARVEEEERGIGFPGWFLRYLYRPLITPTIRKFRHAMINQTNINNR